MRMGQRIRTGLGHGGITCVLQTYFSSFSNVYCMARQCSPSRRKFMECSIISPALSLLMKHLVIGQHRKAPNFSAFHWSPHGSLVFIGQHRNHKGKTFTEKDQNKLTYRSGPNHRIGPGCAGHA